MMRKSLLLFFNKNINIIYDMKQFTELSIIKLVTIVNFAFGFIGIFVSIFTKSSSLMFDGLYSFISSFFTIISARIVKLVTSAENRKYQFGYGAFEPFFIIIRTMAVVGINSFLFSNAIFSIRSGGNEIDISLGIIYTIVSIIICIIITIILKKSARSLESPVLVAEYRSWINDTLLSASIFVAFLFIFIIKKTSLSYIASYIDPCVTIILIIYMLPSLITQFFTNLKELLNAAPPVHIQESLNKIIQPYIEKYDFMGFQIYSAKRGRNLYMIIHVFMKRDQAVSELDKIRKLMVHDIKKFWHHSDIDIIFTIDQSWIPLSVPTGIDN